jgi:ABC-2 type transport system permease protein
MLDMSCPSPDAAPGPSKPCGRRVETLRGLLLGTEIGNNGWLAVAWCLALSALGYFWSKSLFNRDPK